MKESRNYFWNRAVAILLVLVMVLGSISWQGKSEVVAAEGETKTYTITVRDDSNNVVADGVNLSINESENEVIVNTTDTAGVFTCELEEGKKYSYTVSADKYITLTSDLTAGDDADIDVAAGSSYAKVRFCIYDNDELKQYVDGDNIESIVVRDSNGVPVEIDGEDGTYHLIPGETYTYSLNGNYEKENNSNSFTVGNYHINQDRIVNVIPVTNIIKFNVTKKYNSAVASGAKITINRVGSDNFETHDVDVNGEVSFAVKKPYEYNYSIVYDGYPTETGTISGTETDKNIELEFPDIELTSNNGTGKPGDIFEIKVKEPVNGAVYSWSTSNSGVGSLSPEKGESVKITAGKTTESEPETAEITVSCEGKSATYNLTVNKNDSSASFDVKPIGTENETITDNATGAELIFDTGNPIATGTVTFSYKIDNSETTIIVEDKELENGKAKCEFKDSDVLGKGVTFTAKYSGDKNTKACELSSGKVQYFQTKELKLSDALKKDVLDNDNNKVMWWTTETDSDGEKIDVLNIDYNSYKDNTIAIDLDDNTVFADDTISYTASSNEDESVKFNVDNEIEINKLGETLVTIKRNKNENEGYLESEITFKVIVTKKVSFSDLLWSDNNIQASYAGELGQTFEVVGKYVLYDINNDKINDETLEITFRAEVPANESGEVLTKAGEYTQLVVIDANETNPEFDIVKSNLDDLKNYFRFDSDSLTSSDLTISKDDGSAILNVDPIKLKVKVNGTSYTYEKDVKSAIVDNLNSLKGQVVLFDGEIDKVINDEKNNDTEIIDNALKGIGLQFVGNTAEKLYVATYENSIAPASLDVKLDNYILSCDEENYADLKITEYDILNLENKYVISLSGNNYYCVTDENDNYNTIWLQYANGNLVIKPNSIIDRLSEYDQVILNNNNVSDDNGLSGSEVSNEAEYSYYLNDSSDSNGKTKTTSHKIGIYVDSDAPEVTFGQEKTKANILANLLDVISFGMFSKEENEYYILPFEVTDHYGSGINFEYLYYSVVEVTDEVKQGVDISTDELEKKIEAGEVNWTKCSAQVDVEIPNENTAEYIVLVKARDNVNNERIYASNGIIIDHEPPTVSIEGLDEDTIYGEGSEIKYSIDANDGAYNDTETGKILGMSGVDRIKVEIQVDGDTKENKIFYAWPDETGDDELQEEPYDKLISSPDIDAEGNNRGYSKELTLSNDYNSNNIIIKATAYDRAGNVSDVVEQHIKVDRAKPAIKVEYDEKVPANTYYFKEARVATVTFTERNFDEDKAVFDLTLENETKYTEVTLEELNDIDGIDAKWISDSQEGFNETQFTDEREIVAEITFKGDNVYSNFAPHCIDNAGNKNDTDTVEYDVPENAKGTEIYFVIDTKDPIIDIKYYIDGKEISPGRIEDARLYSNKTIDAVVTITEHNFALENGFAEEQINYNIYYTRNSAEVPEYQEQAKELSAWTTSGDISVSNKFVFSVDAKYSTNFTYTDLAGRSAEWKNDYFTVDRTPPTGSIKLADKNVVETFIDIITFHKNPYLFSQTPVKVEMEGSDATSPVRYIEYYKAYEPMTKEQLGKVKWTKVNGNKERYSVEAEYSVGANEQFVPYLRVTDFAGNYDYFSSDTFTFVDNQKPLNEDSGKPIVTITASEPSHGIYNDNVPFHIHAEDPVVGDTYSGLQSVRYEVLTDDKVTQSNTYNFNANDRQRTMDKDEVVTASINNSNNVKIRVTAIDNAGNEVTEIKEIKIDVTKPVINITFDNNSPLNDKYYKDTRTATVTVTERNFDESAFQFTITNTDGTQPSISGWSHSANSGVSDDATHTCTISFSADGDYNMSAVCTDLASNTSDSVNVEEFTVDKTIPEITVTYDVTSGSTNGYFNQQRLATIRINEHNFNAADVQTKIEAMLEGAAISAPSIVGWSHEGDYHTATVLYDADGDYTFDISYSDLAGNAANTYAQDVFTIDTTDPEVDIEMPKDSNGENKTAYGNEEVAPRIICADINQDLNAITVSLINMRNPGEEVDTPYTISGSDKEQIIVFQDFEHTKDMDGLYVLKVATTDKAGNVTEEELTFSVNRFGAYYILSDETRDLVSNYYTNEEQEVVITEYNLSKINAADSKVYYTRDGETVNLSQSDNYERTEVTNQGWNEYKYVIDAANFKAEGYYDVAVESEDVTGNKMTNKLNKYTDDDNKYNSEINFIIDKTNPSITINGLDEETYNEISHEATVITTDNIAVWSVDVYIIEEGKLTDDSIEATVNAAYHFDNKARKDDDGNTIEGEISALHGELPIVINEANDHQIIKAVALDAAGNVMSSEEYRVLVTSNVFVQFYNNTPVLITSIVILLCIMAGIIILLAKRKKKEDK